MGEGSDPMIGGDASAPQTAPEPAPKVQAATVPANVVPATPRSIEEALARLPFHEQIIGHLKETERDLWDWFASPAFREKHDEEARLELLKTCYRFDRSEHADLYAMVGEIADALGLRVPVTLYQAQNEDRLNACLVFTPGEAHVVLSGPMRTRLDAAELRTVIAHELTHYLLWTRGDGDLLVAAQMLGAMASQANAKPSHLETCRLFQLYLEVHADRGTLAVDANPLPAIAGLLKVQTGLEDVSASAYLAQADEIFARGNINTAELTHPEAFIRARSLQLWSVAGAEANDEIARMLEGVAELARLTLLDQRRLSNLTAKLLGLYLQPASLQSDGRMAHARLFFPDLVVTGTSNPAALEEIKGAVETASQSVKDYFAYVLLDLAAADRQDESALHLAYRLAIDLGLEDAFARISGDELKLSKRARTKLKKDASDTASTPSASPAAS